jgi:AraC-like DNA-binding protein
VDLVTATLARVAEAEDAQPPRRAPASSTPDLTPGRIATAHNISLSHLHRLFKAEDETVAAHIRRKRLEGPHTDLADPRLATTPVHVIAARWGFPRPADFTRAFRTAYGLPPRAHRSRASRC